MISIYQLKPRFQALLRPIVGRLAAAGVTANQVTLAAMLISLALGLGLFLNTANSSAFLLLPLWMFLRMAFNAVDGMLAREFGQQSPLGAYFNELSDVISDAALYLPFVAIAPFGWGSVGAVIFLSAVSEMAGALGPMVGAPRQYDGPMGKSDRAFLFGALGLWLGVAGSLPDAALWIMPAAALAILLNTINRIRSGVRQARTNP
ncbi:CDP-alcohol phosphatidyltransferase family protein [Zoogloea sp.]|jgi:CDP-diacylglycerol--glycerol-3-phosphate 3-phosphatidyltransferase|uniref:CDP-alcohol phosphatidyltransferase family protein n=1 Tax=Zoogloea sp. TaxID=49181 RepID=UPI0011DA0E03|nr:CDP-alcohol phosphatidyltransferase family protein [Zoogloea sp.]MBK6656602.1 CDP-alcohol phosphatidyltransferase family protein [Zoogloea sp.]MBP7444931.1 CDP-alcohol phosphatidyltransferase family protein [Zoogloea sp.]TXG95781.1 MAG: CDP-alcohol phosphatidyltransferase family protein [Zoogloea sp.]HOY02733.1 CDP-alcohol phosphatidyltransferase family protein [Zoogloea sp.]HPI61982.1 CDP-alcohol phosphatidyltransferase family protein [Zoogloea sp.]